MAYPYCSNKNCQLPNPQILNELHKEVKWGKIAKAYGVSERTIYRHAKTSNRRLKRGRKRKIDGKVRDKLLDFTAYCSKDNTLTQQEMADLIQKEEKVIISQQTISRFLVRRKRNHKKITPHYQEQNINQVKQFRETIKNLSLSQFSAIDECHFYLNESPRYGYAPVGQRAISPAPGSKGGSYSLIMWVKNKKGKGMINWKLTDEKVNTQVFHDFLDKVKSLGEEEDYLIMDNASFHRAPDKRKELGLPSIEEQLSLKNSQLLSLPSRSPQLNPVELIINVVRHNIEKSRSWTFEKLRDSISEEMRKLNEEDLNKFFKKSLQENLLKLINEEDKVAIAWERWAEIKRMVTEMDRLTEKDFLIYRECKEVIEGILLEMNKVESYQEEWNKKTDINFE
jgi:transposase